MSARLTVYVVIAGIVALVAADHRGYARATTQHDADRAAAYAQACHGWVMRAPTT